ncbi:ADP-ribosylation factor-like protein 15 isoform X1, partial [Tachysurus ichikawai]
AITIILFGEQNNQPIFINFHLCFFTQIKKYFELEPLARGKSWLLEGSTMDHMDAVKESFSQLINLLEEKDQEIGRI